MRKIAVVIFDFVLTLILVWLLVSCLGCASKKKDSSSVNELHSNTELQTSEAAAEIKVNTNVVATAKTETNASSTTTKMNYKPIDPTKPASVVTPEGKKYLLDNAEVTEEHRQETETKKTDESTIDTSSSSVNYWGKDSSYIHLEDIKTHDTNSLDRSGFNFWSWLWILIFIIIVILLNYLNNRFKWLSYVTSLFKKK